MTPEQMEKCREWFEREGLTNAFGRFSNAKRDNGDYDSSHSQIMWLTAQAAWSAAQAQGVDFVAALKEAQLIVEASPLYRKFIDGTPLENDIAVWMAEFAVRKAGANAQY